MNHFSRVTINNISMLIVGFSITAWGVAVAFSRLINSQFGMEDYGQYHIEIGVVIIAVGLVLCVGSLKFKR